MMPLRTVATSLPDYATQFFAGTVAAVATTPDTASGQWHALLVSASAIATSVLVTGLLNNWLNRRSIAKALGKTDAETKKTHAETLSIELDQAIRLSKHKDEQIERLIATVAELKLEIETLSEEVASLKAENVQLVMLLARKFKTGAVSHDLVEMLRAALQSDEGENSSGD